MELGIITIKITNDTQKTSKYLFILAGVFSPEMLEMGKALEVMDDNLILTVSFL